jgi:hypothetical protein
MAKKEYGTRKKYHFIYKTTNLLSGRYYIGMHSTDDLNDGYLGSGTYLKRSINKHGKENHSIEILEYLNSREELAAREREVVSLQEIAKKECMNLKVGGSGGFSREASLRGSQKGNATHTRRLKEDEEYLEYKIKQLTTGFAEKWKTDSEFRLEVLGRLSFKGRTHTEGTIQKMKQSHKGAGKGELNSQYGKCWITNEVENKKIYKGDSVPEGWRLGRKFKIN